MGSLATWQLTPVRQPQGSVLPLERQAGSGRLSRWHYISVHPLSRAQTPLERPNPCSRSRSLSSGHSYACSPSEPLGRRQAPGRLSRCTPLVCTRVSGVRQGSALAGASKIPLGPKPSDSILRNPDWSRLPSSQGAEVGFLAGLTRLDLT